jgi:hypothetical protein
LYFVFLKIILKYNFGKLFLAEILGSIINFFFGNYFGKKIKCIILRNNFGKEFWEIPLGNNFGKFSEIIKKNNLIK